MKQNPENAGASHFRLVPFLVVPLLAFTCAEDYQFAPVIRNTLDSPVVVSVRYGSGDSFESMELAPSAEGFPPSEGIGVIELTVRADGEVIFALERENLERARSHIPPSIPVVWEIRKDGVVPLEYSPRQ